MANNGGHFCGEAEGYVEPPNCYQPKTFPFISEKESRMFIKVHRGKRSVDCTGKRHPEVTIDCINDETSCECNIQHCSKESDREYYCQHFGTKCGPGQICYLSTPCPEHWSTTCTDNACLSYPCKHGTCTDEDDGYTCTCEPGYEGVNCETEINECDSNPCLNGATCHDHLNYYTCACADDFTGTNCETEINECDSNPCLNGATCHDHLNYYTCACADDFTGTNCETDMCRPQFPTGGDLVFLLDASESQSSEKFEKQKKYVQDFISKFPVGQNDFKFALMTVSLNASVEFYLNTYTKVTQMISHIDSIQVEEGPSYTGKGLQVIREEIFTGSRGARSNVNKYVLVLSDGLSSNETDSILQAGLLKGIGAQIICVAVGGQINHKELIAIASHWAKVFPISNNDARNAIYKAHVMDECSKCYHSTTDVGIMLDQSSDVSPVDYYKQVNALVTLLKATPIGRDSVRVGCSHFSQDVTNIFRFDQYFSVSDVVIALNGMQQSPSAGNITNALRYLRKSGFQTTNGARVNSRKIALLVTMGQFDKQTQIEMMQEVEALKEDNVLIATISVSENSNVTSLLAMTSDPKYVYVLVEKLGIHDNVLYSLVSTLDYDVCDVD